MFEAESLQAALAAARQAITQAARLVAAEPLPGPAARDNMILLCIYHHHLVHDHGWHVIGNARSPGLHFRSPDGKTHQPARRHPLIPERQAC